MANDPGRSPLRGKTFIIAAALLGLFGAFGYRMWLFPAPPAIPSLLDGLPESRSDADQKLFQQRLKARFHVGSKEVDDLVDELTADGFTVDADKDVATYDRPAGDSDKCSRSANIHWSRGEGDELAKISGGYYMRCAEH